MARARKLPDLSTFQGLLTTARRVLDTDTLRDVLSALPDEDAATQSLNAKLVALRLRLERDASGAWRIQSGGRDATTALRECDDALLGIARLIEADGWHRIKTCQSPDCTRPYIDLTNGTIRKFCDVHRIGPRYRRAD